MVVEEVILDLVHDQRELRDRARRAEELLESAMQRIEELEARVLDLERRGAA